MTMAHSLKRMQLVAKNEVLRLKSVLQTLPLPSSARPLVLFAFDVLIINETFAIEVHKISAIMPEEGRAKLGAFW